MCIIVFTRNIFVTNIANLYFYTGWTKISENIQIQISPIWKILVADNFPISRYFQKSTYNAPYMCSIFKNLCMSRIHFFI